MKNFKCVLALIAVSMLAFSCASTGGSSGEAVEVITFTWDFDDPDAGTTGWEVAVGEFWDYKGTAALSWDNSTFSNGMLKFDVDFSADGGSEWSEPKIKCAFAEDFSLRGITKFTFDIYYNPNFSTKGSFNSKVILLNGTRTVMDSVGNLINAKEDAGNGYLKTTISLRIPRSTGTINNIVFSIAGYLTNYKGPVFFDNLRLE